VTAAAAVAPAAEKGGKSGPRFAIIRFPGSNCDQDAFYVVRDVLCKPVEYVWHEERSLAGFDVVILPGGFSYGDYLRTGAVARFAPVMDAVRAHAERGGFVLGICNGFQVLCEAQLLPGALVRNDSCQFRCRWVNLRVENTATPFTSAYRAGQVVRIPIAHGEGRYVCDEPTLRDLESSGRILFRYVSSPGTEDPHANPNGSMAGIAGIANARFNVLGMMPHPERASEQILGSADGLGVFKSLLTALLA
jgi:phosphoribosylformylglycinamidine synthase